MRNTARHLAALLIALLLLVSLPLPAFGAEARGTVNVTVQSAEGTPIFDVSIMATALAGSYTSWKPNLGGAPHSPTQLPPGQYRIAVSAIGYAAPATQTVTVAANETQTVTFVMSVPANPGQLSGRVIDQSTVEPLAENVGVKLTRQSDGAPYIIRLAEDGTFSIPVIESGTYIATTYATTWEARQAYITEDRLISVTISPGKEARVDLSVRRNGIVKAQILTPDGSEAEEAQLILTNALNSTWTYSSSPDCCTTALAPGVYSIRAGGLGYKESPVQRVTVTAGKTVALTFQVEPVPTGSVRGRLLDSGGAPIPDANVALEDSKGQRVGRFVRTDADGVFTFPRVAPGTYAVRPSAPGYIYSVSVSGGSPVPGTVRVEVGKTATTELTLSRAVLVKFRVVDEAGKVIPGAFLRFAGSVVRPERDQEGDMLLYRSEGAYDVTAGAPLYQESASQRVVLDPAEGPLTVTIQLKPLPTGTITGKVTNLTTGAPVPGIPVVLVDPSSLLLTSYRTVAGQDGTFTLKDVPIGEYSLAGMGEYDAGQVNPVRVEAGKTISADLQVRSYGRLVIRVQDQAGKAIRRPTVRVSLVGSGVWTPLMGDVTGVVSQRLEVGTYRMTVNAPGYKGKVVLATDVVYGKSTLVVVTMEASK